MLHVHVYTWTCNNIHCTQIHNLANRKLCVLSRYPAILSHCTDLLWLWYHIATWPNYLIIPLLIHFSRIPGLFGFAMSILAQLCLAKIQTMAWPHSPDMTWKCAKGTIRYKHRLLKFSFGIYNGLFLPALVSFVTDNLHLFVCLVCLWANQMLLLLHWSDFWMSLRLMQAAV